MIRELHTLPLRRLFATALLVLLVSQLGISLFAWSRIERQVLPELERKAHTVSSLTAQKISRALEHGIPLTQLQGVGEFFDEIRRENPEIVALRLVDLQGWVLFASEQRDGAVELQEQQSPVHFQGQPVARLQLSIDRAYIATRLAGLRLDLAIVLLTSMLIAFEVLLFVITRNFSGPMLHVVEKLRRIAAGEPLVPDTMPRRRIVAVRILCFLFLFAEILSRPFFPLYAGSFNSHGLAGGLAVSLPLSAFLLASALTMPFAGRWSDQVGRQRSYVTGAIIALCALLLTAIANDLFILVAARVGTGIGYAIMYMACQGYIADHALETRRGQGPELFVGAIMVAEVCGPAVGGILADQLGHRPVFLFGAILALAAAWLGWRILDNRSARVAPPAVVPALRPLLRNRRFACLCLLSGVPAKLLYAGFLIYLAPVSLAAMGASTSEIGRHVMLYGVLVLCLAPLFSRLADRFDAYAQLVAIGGLLTGAGLLGVLLQHSPLAMTIAICALGIGQSMSLGAQFILVGMATQDEARLASPNSVIGIFRMIERLGSAAGPALAAALATAFGTATAIAVLGGFGLLCAILFMLAWGRSGSAG